MARAFAFPSRRDTYWRRTLRPVHSLVIVGPLLVFFHAMTAYYGSRLAGPRLVGEVLRYFGATEAFLPGLLVIVVLVFQQIARRDPWAIDPATVGGMMGESVLWTLPLIGIGQLTGRLAAAAGAASAASGRGALDVAVEAAGAGVYEEFVFRLVLISLTVFLLTDLAGLRRDRSTAIAVLVAAVAFSLCHFSFGSSEAANAFRWPEFIFLAVAGVLWGGLYVYRGFAVAVGSHLFWDLFVGMIR